MILNLTQHAATHDQLSAGVVEPADKAAVQASLTFEEPPNLVEMISRAERLAKIVAASGCNKAMIGGAPYFMAPLEAVLRRTGVTPLYSFTRRETVDDPQQDGSVRKTQVFRHVGWVEAPTQVVGVIDHSQGFWVDYPMVPVGAIPVAPR